MGTVAGDQLRPNNRPSSQVDGDREVPTKTKVSPKDSRVATEGHFETEKAVSGVLPGKTVVAMETDRPEILISIAIVMMVNLLVAKADASSMEIAPDSKAGSEAEGVVPGAEIRIREVVGAEAATRPAIPTQPPQQLLLLGEHLSRPLNSRPQLGETHLQPKLMS